MPAFSPDDIRGQLDRILADPSFAHAGRMGRFLRFPVERAIEGGAGELKEYLVAVEVFDKETSFDPRLDPIPIRGSARWRGR